MATAEPMAAFKKPSMAALPGEAKPKPSPIVPVGAAPVVPAYVPPARQYDDEDDDDADELSKPQIRSMMNPSGTQGPSTIVIFSVALVLLTLAAVASFYALDAIKNAEAVSSSTAATTSPHEEPGNDTVQNAKPIDDTEVEATSLAYFENELDTIPPVDTT